MDPSDMIHAILLYKQTSKVVLTCYNVFKKCSNEAQNRQKKSEFKTCFQEGLKKVI